MKMLPGAMYDVDILANQEGAPFYIVPRRRFHPRTTPFRGCYLDKNELVIELASILQSKLMMLIYLIMILFSTKKISLGY